MSFKIAVIGAGALGKSLGAHFFSDEEVFYFGRSEAFWNDINGKKQQTHQLDFENENVKQLFSLCDIVFIATQDQEIPNVVEQIKEHVKTVKWVLHGSGSISSQVLDVLKINSKVKTGVIHFLQTFYKESYLKPFVFDGIFASVMGDSELIFWLKKRADKKKVKFLKVTEEQKKQLHIAAVFACNFQHVLIDAANRVVKIDNKNIMEIFAPLIRTTLNSIHENGEIVSLSGPIKRGDEQVIASHIDYLKDQPEIQHIYKELSTYLKNRLKEDEKKS